MKTIIFGIFISLCALLCSTFIKIMTIEFDDNDCMIQYVASNQNHGYIYKIDTFKYHIDTENLNYLEQIGFSNGCTMNVYEPKFSFVAISNTFYCSVVSLMI